MKQRLVEMIRSDLRERLERLARAAMEAHAAATDPGSKAEGKYDTRSLEASYLAAGQARQVDEWAEALRIFEVWNLPEFGPGDAVDAGALVEVRMAGETACFFLAPVAGGMVFRHEGREVTLLTPDSPLYQQLVDLRVGDVLERPPLTIAAVS